MKKLIICVLVFVIFLIGSVSAQYISGDIYVREDGSVDFSVESDVDLEEALELYIRPYEIGKKKWFGFIPTPWGKKLVKIEVVKGSKVFKKKISEFDEELIKGYRVEVGSLEDEENIEFEIEKIE